MAILERCSLANATQCSIAVAHHDHSLWSSPSVSPIILVFSAVRFMTDPWAFLKRSPQQEE